MIYIIWNLLIFGHNYSAIDLTLNDNVMSTTTIISIKERIPYIPEATVQQ